MGKASKGLKETTSAGIKSKTQTLIVHKHGSKIPVRAKVGDLNDIADDVKAVEELGKKKSKPTGTHISSETKFKALTTLNERLKGNIEVGIMTEALERRKTRTTLESDKRIRSSGYGAPGNANVRPKGSATRVSSAIKQTRERSTASTISKTTDTINPDETNEVRNRAASITRSNLKVTKASTKPGSLNDIGEVLVGIGESAMKGQSKRGDVTHRTELSKIREIVREESENSDIPDQSELQMRLSSIKRKVEVRRRRGDSRSSFGSDLDSSFQDRWVLSR